MKWIRHAGILVFFFIVGLSLILPGVRAMGGDWRTASRESTGQAPDPKKTTEPIVQVYAARTYGWRGAFGVHTWIATKSTAANHYTIYQVVGWRARYGDSVLVISEDMPDRQWYGNHPEIIAELRGDGVEGVIERIENCVRLYPYMNTYTMYPGPNSNTFTAWVARQVPDLKLDLPPTAIGKDYLGAGLVAETPSGTGFQISIFGLLGILVGVEEGFEVNVAGLTFGIDPMDFALKLPGLGRVGRHSSVNE